jgi:hypothetical protein
MSIDVEPSTGRLDIPRRVLVVYTEGRAGTAALREAAELTASGRSLRWLRSRRRRDL